MGASDNTMSGKTWIGKSRHTFCVKMARHFEAQQRRALESGNSAAAEQYRLWGFGFLHETEEIDSGKPKRIVSDTEAARLRVAQDEAQQAAEDTERLTVLKRKLGITPRANGSAYRPLPRRPSQPRQRPLTLRWVRGCAKSAPKQRWGIGRPASE